MKFKAPYWLALIGLVSAGLETVSQETGVKKNAVVKSIEISGNKKIPAEKILNTLSIRKNQPFMKETLSRELPGILELYRKQHYYLASVDTVETEYTVDSAEVKILIRITENKPVRTGRIAASGQKVFSETYILQNMELSTNAVFDPAVLAQDMEYLLGLYDNAGHPFARISIPECTVVNKDGQPAIDMTLAIEEGPEVNIRSIRFEGNMQTQSRILHKYFGYAVPSLYRQEKIETGTARLRKLTFIDQVEEAEIIRYQDSLYDLQIRVTEGASNTIDGIAGYVPKRPNTDERGYFTGMINLSFQNLFGTARRLDFRWQKKSRYSQDFLIAYTEPWVLNWPLQLTASLQQFVQDTIYVERNMALDAVYEINPNWQITGGVKRKTIDPSGTANSFALDIPTAEFLSGSFGVRYDTRDDRMNPSHGLYYNASVEYSRKTEMFFDENPDGKDTVFIGGVVKILSRENRKFFTQHISMDFEGYFPLTRRVVIFDGMHGSVYKTPQDVVPYSEQLLFGGLNSLRGYTQDFFNGTRIGWNNLELRWLTSRKSRIFIFWDAGYYYRKAYANAEKTILKTEDQWPVGYGFGLRFQTRMGLFGLDYGLGKHDTFSTGKVHFGITSQF